jgi:hypothetical protein
MERRRSKRIIVRLEAEIISRAKSYPGFLETTTEFPGVSFYTYAGMLENLSEDGMLITVPENTKINFKPGETLEIGFQLPLGERLNLNCMVRRFQNETPPHGLRHSIGIVIINPPPIFSKFIKDGVNQIK